jgi:thermitase
MMTIKIRRFSVFYVILASFILVLSGCTGSPGIPEDQPLSEIPVLSPEGVSEPPTAFLPDEILVRFENGVPAAVSDLLIQRLGAERLEELNGIGTLRLRVPANRVESLVARFLEDPSVEYAEPNYTRFAMPTPNDTYFGLQWGWNNTGQSSSCYAAGTPDADIDAVEAWDITTGSSSVKIAILDTGIQSNHPDLTGKVVASKSFVGGSMNDGNGHGSHVAGTASALSNNGKGVAGASWASVLLNGKVLNNAGYGSASSSANGITWAADKGAKAINMSYGSSAFSQTEQNAVNYAWNKGAVLVGAAGNSNVSTKFYPAAYTNVIAVAATDNNDLKASFSNYGSWVHVAAPGVCIASTYKNSGYAWMSGTSQASPAVTGLAALVFARFPSYTNAQVRDTIFNTADAIAGTGSSWVYGRVNAFRAVQ